MGCPVCAGECSERRWDVRDRLFRSTAAPFEIRRCVRCAVLFLHPTPRAHESRQHYPEGYWGGGAKGRRGVRARWRERYRSAVLCDQVRFVARIVAEQCRRGLRVRLLDVGCGDGSVLAALDAPARCGLDVAAQALRAARHRGLDVACGTLPAYPFADGSFSLVTMFHYLEHVAPRASLRAAARLLAPDGDLVVQVPNAESWQAALLGGKWSGFDVPRHLVNYSPATLRRTLEADGFTIVRATQFSLRDNTALLASSLAPALYPPARAARQRAEGGTVAWVADLAYLGLTAAVLPFVLIESMVGRGATVMVQARRAG